MEIVIFAHDVARYNICSIFHCLVYAVYELLEHLLYHNKAEVSMRSKQISERRKVLKKILKLSVFHLLSIEIPLLPGGLLATSGCSRLEWIPELSLI